MALLRLTLLLALAASAAQAEPVVIVNRANPVSTLTVDAARKLLLGEELSWPNGDAVDLIEVRGESPSSSAGYLAITRRTLSQVRAAWNRLVFSGRANPPLRLGSEAEVRAAVASTPTAIAVVDSSAVDPTVKVVLRVQPSADGH